MKTVLWVEERISGGEELCRKPFTGEARQHPPVDQEDGRLCVSWGGWTSFSTPVDLGIALLSMA